MQRACGRDGEGTQESGHPLETEESATKVTPPGSQPQIKPSSPVQTTAWHGNTSARREPRSLGSQLPCANWISRREPRGHRLPGSFKITPHPRPHSPSPVALFPNPPLLPCSSLEPAQHRSHQCQPLLCLLLMRGCVPRREPAAGYLGSFSGSRWEGGFVAKKGKGETGRLGSLPCLRRERGCGGRAGDRASDTGVQVWGWFRSHPDSRLLFLARLEAF